MTGDMNCGIFTASGDPAVVATGIYFHTMLNNAQLKYAKKYYEPDPTVGLADGDIYFFNDELGGGVHPFDMFTAMPVFYRGHPCRLGDLRRAPGRFGIADAGRVQRQGAHPLRRGFPRPDDADRRQLPPQPGHARHAGRRGPQPVRVLGRSQIPRRHIVPDAPAHRARDRAPRDRACGGRHADDHDAGRTDRAQPVAPAQ